MNGFKGAHVHELESILRFVDSKALHGENLDFILAWATEGTKANSSYTAQLIIWFLDGLGER